MDTTKLEFLFSKSRLKGYENLTEHRDNFLLIGKIAPKLGLVEIVTRNKIARILDIKDDAFISQQSFGYWAKLINIHSIHNQILNINELDFRKYSPSNRKTKLRNFYKVRICYDLLVQIRNRAFHFENLFKLINSKPRISTLRSGEIVGIMPKNIEAFIDDILICFDADLVKYLKNGEKEKLSPLTSP